MREEQRKAVLDRSVGINSSQAFYFSLVNGEIPKQLLDTRKPCQDKSQDRNRLSAKNTRTMSNNHLLRRPIWFRALRPSTISLR